MSKKYDLKTLAEEDRRKVAAKVRQMKQATGATETGQQANAIKTDPEIVGSMAVGVGIAGR